MVGETPKERWLNEPDTNTPEGALLKKELKEIIESKLDQLDPTDRTILEMLYGLRGREEMTLAEIADKGGLGLTLGQVAHREREARRAIRMMKPIFSGKNREEILKIFDE
ncbi:MAG: sigma factor-like helix-turn-helix DNA-binding protein [Minisyncoccia bacterium]